MYYKKGSYDRAKKNLTLQNTKDAKIKESKLILQEYLKENPLFSYAKYEDGRYYTITQEKQQQLTSKLFMATTKALNNEPYTLTWNDTGNICEVWTLQELSQLSDEIDKYITALVTKQQHLEVEIKNATTIQEVEGIEINYDS